MRFYKTDEKPLGGVQAPQEEYRFLRVARIAAVDSKQGTARIVWLDRVGEAIVPLTFPFLGLHGGLVTIPEVGSKVIVGWVRGLNQDVGSPMILAYLPENYVEALTWNTSSFNVVKVSEGEVGIQSKQSSLVYVDENVTLSDQYGNQIQINSDDSSINLQSIMYFASNEAYSLRAGLVKRKLIPDPLTLQLSDKVITQFNVPFEAGGKAFTELNVAVSEFGNTTLNKPSEIAANEANPLVRFFAGTKVNDLGVPVDVTNTPTVIPGTESILEVETQGVGTNKGFFLHVSREGRAYVNIPRAIKDTSHLHDSLELDTDGRCVFKIGKDTLRGESVNSDLQGGIVSHVGKTVALQHSYKATLDGGVEVNVGRTATGYSIKISGSGKMDITVDGDANITSRGNVNIKALAKVSVEATNVEVKGVNVKITGGTLTTNGNVPPTGTGPYCALPVCILTGAPHVGTTVVGT
jgi:hypothetical protein